MLVKKIHTHYPNRTNSLKQSALLSSVLSTSSSLAIGVFVAFLAADRPEDIALVAVLNAIPVALIAVVGIVGNHLRMYYETNFAVCGGAIAGSSTVIVSWLPLFRVIGGAPIVGWVIAPIGAAAAVLIGAIGGLMLSMVVKAVRAPRDTNRESAGGTDKSPK